MKYSANEIKVGVVVMTCITLFVVFFIALAGSGILEKTVPYKTRLIMSAGLEPGDVIRYGGMKVGRITDVFISEDDPQRIDVFFQVGEGTPVKTDSELFINYLGLLGDYYLEITAGSPDADLMPAGSMISPKSELMQFSDVIYRVDSISDNLLSVTQTVDRMFKVIDEKVELILTSADQVLANVNQFINEENRAKAESILNNVEHIMQVNADTISGILGNLESMLAQVDALSKSLNNVVVNNEQQIQDTMKLLQHLLISGEEAVVNVNSIISSRKQDIENTVTNIGSM